MEIQWPCPKCIRTTTWKKTDDIPDMSKGTSTCQSCKTVGTNVLGICPAHPGVPQYLYPTTCSRCLGHPAQMYQISNGQVLTAPQGTFAASPGGAAFLMIHGNTVYASGNLGNVKLNECKLVVGIP
eukprot:TRINITY_DN29376_c0_g1_i1.p1 TRINITY_DN29376_c0_g1~~TRINITY_DN29376_c0_g1_i1.p1  ORF type:complete len:126 (-),score=11.50 TRINITY_DN29376_c0_g1_i1:153-530(-)